MTGQGLKCPKCGSTRIDEFERAYWFMCRDCGYNSVPNSDREKALSNFLNGYELAEQIPEEQRPIMAKMEGNT